MGKKKVVLPSIQMESVYSFNNYRQELEAYLESLIGEQFTMQTAAVVKAKRDEFTRWLSNKGLYLVNDNVKSQVGWDLSLRIISLLRKFDEVIVMIERTFNSHLEMLDNELIKRFKEFDNA